MSGKTTSVNREHKDSLFRIIFREKKDLLELYNALNGTQYTNEEDLVVNTLEDAIYLGMKNDLSFLIRVTLNLYEHQSTFNPNMGVRGLLYFADLYQAYIDMNGLDLYSSRRLKLPFPQYMVFYNGTAEKPERMTIRLSDTFTPHPEGKEPAVECSATMLNINLGHNRELMEKCRRLREYAVFVDSLRRRRAEGKLPKQAMEETVDECIRNGVLGDILRKNRAEVMKLGIYDYDEELHIKCEKQISFEDGQKEGIEKGREEGRKEGREKGRKEGIEEGREEGRKEGREKGREEGRKEGRKTIARNMHTKGYLDEVIADLLETSTAEIRQWIAADSEA